uniref:ABC transporter permease n=1 Tax=candidate division WOR-3 bacterium TaxID=2052148 RepID=A0A7V3KNW3_UNCW3
MRRVWAVFWKELRSFYGFGWMAWLGVLVALAFGPLQSLRMGATGFLVTSLWGIFGGVYLLETISFYYERTQGSSLMLLSSPLTVGEIFLGKYLAIFLVAYLTQLVALAISACVIWSTFAVLPPPSLLPMLFITIPIYGFVFMELYSLAYALLGNVSYLWLVMVLIFPFLLSPPSQIMPIINWIISFPALPIVLGILLALLLFFVVSRISKERMVMVLS